MIRAVSLIGFKKSGKTTLAVELVEEIRNRGFKVGFIKSSHQGFDMPDTDTAKMSKLGVNVAGLSDSVSAVFWPHARHFEDIVPLLDAEVLVVEGRKTLGVLPRILLLKERGDSQELNDGLGLAAYGPVKDPALPSMRSVGEIADMVLQRGFLLPGLDCGACGHNDCKSLAREIVGGNASAEDCKAKGAGLSVKTGGHPLVLNPFVERMIVSTLRGMLSTLKGYQPGNIDICIEQQTPGQ